MDVYDGWLVGSGHVHNPVASLSGFRVRSFKKRSQGPRQFLYELEWAIVEVEDDTEASKSPSAGSIGPCWLLIGDSASAHLHGSGIATLEGRHFDCTARGVLATPTETDAPLAVLLAAPGVGCNSDGRMEVIGAALDVIRDQMDESGSPSAVWLLTAATQLVFSLGGQSCTHATLWGLARTARQENPLLPLRTIDAEAPSPSNARALGLHLRQGGVRIRGQVHGLTLTYTDEAELVLRHGVQRCARLVAARHHAWQHPVHMCVLRFGSIQDVTVLEQPTDEIPAMDDGEIELRVRAVGLNFRDVLNVLGEYPGGPFPFGDDCSAAVRVPSIRQNAPLRMGDPAFGLAPGCLATVVRTDERWMVGKPPCISWRGASTLPTVWSTVHITLERTGCHRAERLLVHAASGGVGMVALGYAQLLYARICGSAGRPLKHREALHHQLSDTFASRDAAAFCVGACQHLGGARLHAVLNSLSADFIATSIAMLASCGDFAEIGKRSVWTAPRMAAGAPWAVYEIIDFAEMVPRDPAWFGGLLRVLGRMVEAGVASALPHQTFALRQASLRNAFRLLMSGSAVGKVVVCVPPERQAAQVSVQMQKIRADLEAHVASAAARDGPQTEQLVQACASLDKLCLQYIHDALEGLGGAVPPKWHHKLLREWCAQQPAPSGGVRVTLEDIRRRHPHLWPELQLVEVCGPQLADVLKSVVPYQGLLFPEGSMERVRPFYEDATTSAFCNASLVEVVRSVLVQTAATAHAVRILEIGAGVGGTASSVLPVVSDVCECYTFTDVSEYFMSQARRRFAEHSFLQCRLLNIDVDPTLQGFARSQYAMVLATNVLHATPWMQRTLRHCWQLLEPGGVLVANELLGTTPFLQITFGMTAGWWLFASPHVKDPARVGAESPCMTWDLWAPLLREAGFTDSHCVVGGRGLEGQAVVVAQRGVALARSPSPCGVDDVRRAANGAHLLTGGLGGLGLLTARMLVERGATKLILTSRSGAVQPGSEADMRALCSVAGAASTTKLACDVSIEQHTTSAMRMLYGSGERVRAIYHAAGVLADATVPNQSVARFETVFGPKVYGAQTLHASILGAAVQAFEVYSSMVALLGAKGQAPHSAACCWLDSIAHFRRARGLPAHSTEWGAVSEIGYAARHGADRRANARGLGSPTRAEAWAALCGSWLTTVPLVVVLPLDLPMMLKGQVATLSLLESLRADLQMSETRTRTRPMAAVQTPAPEQQQGQRSLLPGTPGVSIEQIAAFAQQVAGRDVDADASLMEAGVDSLGAVELRNLLQTALGNVMQLSSTLMFDHPTVRQLSVALECKDGTERAAQALLRSVATTSTAILVAGLDCLQAGGIHTLGDARCAQQTAQNMVGTVPVTRWDVRAQPALSDPMVSRVRHGGFMHGAERADNAMFFVSSAEAAAMDPCQRLLLEHGYAALHAANIDRTALVRSLTGVFIGFGGTGFGHVLAQSPAGGSVYAATGSAPSIASGRLSYALGMHGPCVSYETACSAALTACHAGLRALQLGECTIGLVAGASLMLAPDVGTSFAIAGMTSARGRCHTFDVRADGFARGEACGAVALRCGIADEPISVCGSAVRQDGKSASLTAPNGKAQQSMLIAALQDAMCGGYDLKLLEAHGTGTSLGDPIEAGSLAAVVLKARVAPIAAGGVKANLGHAEQAAGMTGLLNLARGLHKGAAAPNAQLRVLNPHVHGTPRGLSSTLSVQVGLIAAEEAPRGGVSSFGYSGTIVHMVLSRIAEARCSTVHTAVLAYRQRAYPWRHTPHPFAEHRAVASGQRTSFRSNAAHILELVAHHVVKQRVVLPAAGYLEMARAAADASDAASTLRGVVFLKPLFVETVGLLVECALADGRFEVCGSTDGAVADSTLHCSGALAARDGWLRIEHESVRGSCPRTVHVGMLYDGFQAIHLEYGPGYRTLVKAWSGVSNAGAQLRVRSTREGTQVHPADLDDAICLSMLCSPRTEVCSEARLTFSVEKASLHLSTAFYESATAASQSREACVIGMVNPAGLALAMLDGLHSRPLSVNGVLQAQERPWRYQLEWIRMPSDALPVVTRLNLLFICNEPMSTDERSSFASLEHVITLRSDVAAIRHATGRSTDQWHGVVFTDALKGCGGARVTELHVAGATLTLMQSLCEKELPMWVYTAATQSFADERRQFGASLWGLARACRAEYTLSAWCVDVHDAKRDLARVLQQSAMQLSCGRMQGLRLSTSAEPEAAYGTSAVQVPRLLAPCDAGEAVFDVTFEALCHKADLHSSHTAGMSNAVALLAAYASLEAKCQQYLHDAVRHLDAASIPVWHHKLLHAWCANQLASSVATSAVTSNGLAHSDLWPEIQLAERCGPRLQDVLTAKTAYQELLFPGGSMEAVLPVYESGVLAAHYNGCVIATVDAMLRQLPPARSVAVLEVGAGSGGTASSVLPVLQVACKRYIFTDVSEVFLRRARERFAEFAFLEYALLNIDADPRLQGLPLHECDLLIATNVLHATPFVRHTLHHCKQLLCAGATLVVNELLATKAFTQITFGMTEGWWLFAESLDLERIGQNSPLLSWRQWQALLIDSGFSNTHCTQGDTFLRGQAVIAAQTREWHTSAHSGATNGAPNGFGALLTGGLGGLGLLTARVIAEVRAPSFIAILSRSGVVQRGGETDWEVLRSCGVHLLCTSGDGAQLADTHAAVRRCAIRRLPLSVWHMASVFAARTVTNLSLVDLTAMYGPKVVCAQHLHLATLNGLLLDFHLCSSAASLMPFYAKGQASYAAANTWLLSFSGSRRRAGTCSHSVAWGHLHLGKAAAQPGRLEDHARQAGLLTVLRPLITTAIKRTFSMIRDCAVMQVRDWERASNETEGYFTTFTTCRAPCKPSQSPAVMQHSPRVDNCFGLQAVLDVLKPLVGGELHADAPLMEAGLDSLGTIEARKALQQLSGGKKDLPSVLVFDHPTARRIASFCFDKVPEGGSVDAMQPIVRYPSSCPNVAAIGLSLVMPSGAETPRALWAQCMGRADLVTTVPAMRWNAQGDAKSRLAAAFLHSIDLFDHQLFQVPSSEAALMDPAQRLLLERSYESLHKAAMRRAALMQANLGVFLGIDKFEYTELLPALVKGLSQHAVTSTGLCMTAGRVSYALGLQGPCVGHDCACASALAALHSSTRAVQHREATGALVLGVNLILAPTFHMQLSAAGVISPSGRSFSFDARADGMGRGEAVAAAFTDEAPAPSKGDACVAGVAVRQDGRRYRRPMPLGSTNPILRPWERTGLH